jgi:hypothetical protein
MHCISHKWAIEYNHCPFKQGFESRQGFSIISSERAIQLNYRKSIAVTLRCVIVPGKQPYDLPTCWQKLYQCQRQCLGELSLLLSSHKKIYLMNLNIRALWDFKFKTLLGHIYTFKQFVKFNNAAFWDFKCIT